MDDSASDRDDRQRGALDLTSYSGDPNFMLSLARGIVVLEALGSGRPEMTIANTAIATGLSRAAVRRCLYTLSRLGYVHAPDRQHGYALNAGLGSAGLPNALRVQLALTARPILRSIAAVRGVCHSVTTLEADKMICIARTRTEPSADIGQYLDAPIPAYCTAMGRVLIASLSTSAREGYFRRATLIRFTERTLTSIDLLRSAARIAERRGYETCDQEYAPGFCSTAVPIYLSNGQIVASLGESSLSTNHQSNRTSEIVTELQRLAAAMSSSLEKSLSVTPIQCSSKLRWSKGTPPEAPCNGVDQPLAKTQTRLKP